MAWSNIPATGTLSYNGFSFDPLYKSKVTGRMLYDEANRTVIATEYTFDVIANITSASNSNTNATLASMRQALSAPGGILHYDGKGFGTTFSVNDPAGTIKDVAFGPRVQLLEFTPIGDAQAALVHWTCVVTIPEHCANPFFQYRLMAANYEVSISVNSDGLSTVTIAGYLEIPMTRNAVTDRTLNDCADAYFEQIFVNIPKGFRRSDNGNTRSISKDKRRLDYTFEFVQNPNYALPVDCVYASGSQVCRSIGFHTRWANKISATYRVEQDKPKKSAWNAFSLLIMDRIAKTKANPPAGAPGNSVMFLSMSIEDGLYLDSNRVSMSFEYTFISTLQDVIMASGVWTPVPGTDDTQWRSSIANAQSARGLAGLQVSPDDDLIIDLCMPQNRKMTPRPPDQPKPEKREERVLLACPNPNVSWLEYHCDIEVDMEPSIARHKPLSPTLQAVPNLGGPGIRFPIGTGKSNASGGTADSIGYAPRPTINGQQGGTLENIQAAGSQRFASMGSTQLPEDVMQVRTTPTWKVYLIGHAMRACWPVELPTLKSFGGYLAVPGKQTVRTGILTRFSVPVRYATWELEFDLPGTPIGPIGEMPNPAVGAT